MHLVYIRSYYRISEVQRGNLFESDFALFLHETGDAMSTTCGIG